MRWEVNDCVLSEFIDFMFLGEVEWCLTLLTLILRGVTVYFLRVFLEPHKRDNFLTKEMNVRYFFKNVILISMFESSM